MQIRIIFKRYTDLVEPMSIDEAYLDVTINKIGIKSAVKVAKLISMIFGRNFTDLFSRRFLQ